MSKIKVRAAFNDRVFQAVAFCAKAFSLSVEDYVTMCCVTQTQQYIDAAQKEKEKNDREQAEKLGGDDVRGTPEEEGRGQEEA